MSSEVHVGRDGWLFLFGGSNDVSRLYRDRAFFSDALAAEWQHLLLSRHAEFKRRNISYWHIVAPDKISVLPELLQVEFEAFDAHPLARLHALGDARLEDVLVDPTRVLTDQTGRFPTFFKTDSHWTVWGAYKTYRLLCRRMGFEPVVQGETKRIGQWSVTFDLGSKLEPHVSEDHIFMEPSPAVRRVHANDLVAQTEKVAQDGGLAPPHHGCSVVFRNDSPGVIQKTVVIFGDSFSDYRPSSFTWLMAESFREVHFAWTNRIDFDYATQHGADIVVSEIAERFMTTLPQDPIDIEADARDRMAAYWDRAKLTA